MKSNESCAVGVIGFIDSYNSLYTNLPIKARLDGEIYYAGILFFYRLIKVKLLK